MLCVFLGLYLIGLVFAELRNGWVVSDFQQMQQLGFAKLQLVKNVARFPLELLLEIKQL